LTAIKEFLGTGFGMAIFFGGLVTFAFHFYFGVKEDAFGLLIVGGIIPPLGSLHGLCHVVQLCPIGG